MVKTQHDVQICAVKSEKVSCTKMCYFENCERSQWETRESERSERQGVFQRTLRDAPRFSDVQRRIVAVGFGTTGVEF